MAITYNIAKCKQGWGVYVRALSHDDLQAIAPGCTDSVVRVTSGRIARKRSKQSAKFFISRIAKEPREEQHKRIKNVWIKIAPSKYQIIKVQNLKLYRETDSGTMIPTVSTINRTYAENVALYYSSRDKKSFLRKTVTKYLKLPLNTHIENLNTI